MSLTVSELLALEGLSALRLRAGKQGLQRAVRWYYVAENEHIAEWIMGGELVFITGINHPRDEANLIQLLMEGKQRGIAGMVILTGEAYIHAIPATLIALADELGMPLIEQPYLLKMVIVTERIGTALVRSENVLQSQRDILMQLVTGDYPDLQMPPSARPAPAARFYPSAAAGGAASGGVVPPVSPVPARAGRSLAAAGPPQRASAAAAAAQPAGQFLSAAGAQQHVPFPAAG
ncbi:transcriptional regulatory protein [Klebsiella pneumoniae]|uniref:Transcriptional regulatory protein n=1 Tax=Klebsiella pneumoniae TaxID=573 RepID=A0A2X3ECZ3_KLEPN|nr:transcriptional regulatory protein [Klebsiella pneumoniae]